MTRHYITIGVVLALLLGGTAWITGLEQISAVFKPYSWADIGLRTLEHLQMVAIAEGIAIVVSIPLGILTTRPWARFLANPTMGAANMGQAIPSLAFIAIVGPIIGFNFTAVITALAIYGLLPVLRNSVAAIKNINPAILEAARGMGMTNFQIARRIELPLALPIIAAGVRVSTILIVGTAVLAPLVGGGGLGWITFVGVYNNVATLILQGALPTAALAIVLGFLLERLEDFLTPRGLKV